MSASILRIWEMDPDENVVRAMPTCTESLCDLKPHDGPHASWCIICGWWFSTSTIQKHLADHDEFDGSMSNDA